MQMRLPWTHMCHYDQDYSLYESMLEQEFGDHEDEGEGMSDEAKSVTYTKQKYASFIHLRPL